MVGIVSYGGYLPKPRLQRSAVFEAMGWFSPHLAGYRKGERSFCNHDEDALTMAVAASQDCLKGVDHTGVDGVHLCATTLPFDERQNSGILKEALNLSDTLFSADFTGGQRAGTSGLIAGLNAVACGERRKVLVSAAECRLAKAAGPEEMWQGDGAASFIIGDDNVIAEFMGSVSITKDFIDHHRGRGHAFSYGWEERWVGAAGYGMIVDSVKNLLDKLSMGPEEVSTLCYPCYLTREHRKIGERIGVPSERIADNLHMVLGDTGAAHPLVMLSKALEQANVGDIIVVVGFGQGCDALAFRATKNLLKLPSRQGILGSLAEKADTENYTKFLTFRGILDGDQGMKAEAATKTALSVLWRRRDMILGLVGGRCTACETPQFPRNRICVNPQCRQRDTQESYPFAHRLATVKTYTGDMLGASKHPPNIYGLIQFDGGGRMMAAFTDCALNDVAVGKRVKMVFRKRYEDNERGFHGYFWKAVPVRGEEQ